MQIFRHFENLPLAVQGGVVAIGNFDGLHRGHQAVLAEAIRISENHLPLEGRSRASASGWGLQKTSPDPHPGPPLKGEGISVLTLEPHPRAFFQPNAEPFLLTPFRSKVHILSSLVPPPSSLFALHFDQAFSELSADEFIQRVLVDGLKASHVVVGYDFVYGYKRQGNVATLKDAANRHGFQLTVISPQGEGEERVYSSTRVREALKNGNPKLAAEILGRPWEIEGRVEHGDKRGGAIGFPTANIGLGEYLRPKFGVYAVKAGFNDTWHKGVANIGVRPTIGGETPLLEAHIFDLMENLYGHYLRVQLIDFLRPEQKFSGLDELKSQIARDAEQAKRILQ